MSEIEGKRKQQMIVYAPNVHTGGGLKLLLALLKSSQAEGVTFFLDKRSRSAVIGELAEQKVRFFDSNLSGRLQAEREFRDSAAVAGLCFHSLPPLFNVSYPVSIFFQNVNVLDLSGIPKKNIYLRCRSLIERFVFLYGKKRINTFYVQTPSVRQLLISKAAIPAEKVIVLPFDESSSEKAMTEQREGFVYVSDGVAHKNHRCLLDAWCRLAEKGHYPKLTLTLGARDKGLWQELLEKIQLYSLNVINAGYLDSNDIDLLYRNSEALIFPSLKESFGLPLIESTKLGLPILAPELDYVRDVCQPEQTFDPRSPVSIARAVCRFKSWGDDKIIPSTPDQFLQEVKQKSITSRAN